MNNINWNKSGNNFSLIPSSEGILESLPTAIYQVEFHQDLGFYLSHKATSFPEPSKVYNFNNPSIQADLSSVFLTNFTSGTSNLGVLLLGEKGTGKSLLMKRTANQALALGLPVISVENSYYPEGLSKFLSSIKEPCVVLFDEFDKKYDPDVDIDSRPSQAGLLSYFDGTSTNKKLTIITANDEDNINEFYLNRPSRIRYTIRYTGLGPDFIAQYLQDNILYKETIPDILEELDLVYSVNFDLLNSIVKEVEVLYPTLSIKSIISILNIQRDTSYRMYYYGVLTIKDTNQAYNMEFVCLDWEDLNERGLYWVDLDHIGANPLSADYPEVRSTLQIKTTGVTTIKGRNHIKATSTLKLQKGGDPVPVEIELHRIKLIKNAF